MKNRRLLALPIVVLVSVSVAVSAAVWAQAKIVADNMESQVKKATFNYYFGLVLGEQEEYFKGVRLPLIVTLDGKSVARDEVYLKEMIATIHKKNQSAKLTPDDRGVIAKNVVATIDDSPVQFVGAGTAVISFLVQHNEKTMADRFCTLLLHRGGVEKPEWKVIQEVTDGKPVPPEYLK